jgi:hypothetical protein
LMLENMLLFYLLFGTEIGMISIFHYMVHSLLHLKRFIINSIQLLYQRDFNKIVYWMEQELQEMEFNKFFICINNLVWLLSHSITYREGKQDILKTFQELKSIVCIF